MTRHVKHYDILPFLKGIRKMFFKGRVQMFFYISFACFFLLVSSFYIYNLSIFSLFVKNFTVTGSSRSALVLLTNTFTCSQTFNFIICKTNIFLFFLLTAAVEIFTIVRIIFLRKHIRTMGFLVYFLGMQVFAILPLVMFFSSPFLVVTALSFKADADIRTSFTQLNTKGVLQKNHIETSLTLIANKISSNSSLKNFSLAELHPQKTAVLSFLHVSKSGKETLYNAAILPRELETSQFMKNKLPSPLLLFPNNTLVVNGATREIIEKLVPILANKMVRMEFNKEEKTHHISYLNDKNYNIEQKKQEEILLQKQKDYISYLQGFLSDSDDIIQKNQTVINSYDSDKKQQQKAYDDYVSQYGNWYNDCKAQLGNDPLCEQGRNTIDANLNILRQNIQTVEDDYKQAGINITLQTQYKQSAIGDLAIAKKDYQDALNNPVTPELQDGVFDPPNLIFIKYYDKDKKPLTFYLDTTLHEYLHFYSSSETKNLDTFLEEGITDYLKIHIALRYLEEDAIKVGYPYEVEAIGTLAKYIPQDILLSFYLDKDQDELKKWFINRYGANNYDLFIREAKGTTYAPLTDEKIRQKYLDDIEAILEKKQTFSPIVN